MKDLEHVCMKFCLKLAKTKAQSSQWVEKSSPPQKKGTSESIKCEVVDHVFYWKGIVHREFVPRGQTVKGQFYLEVMKRLR
jgi:hypothetical protein